MYGTQYTKTLVYAYLMLLLCQAVWAGPERYARQTEEKEFDEVILDLELAITQRNFAIIGRNRIGKAIRSRGDPDYPHTRVIQFCNVEYAHELLTIDPAKIVYLPCRIAVYERDRAVHVTTLLLPEDTNDNKFNNFARKINGLMREMMEYSVE